MGKKKAAPPKGRPRTGMSPVALSMRGKPTWKQWLSDFANSERVTPSALVDQALAIFAKMRKFKEPPPRY